VYSLQENSTNNDINIILYIVEGVNGLNRVYWGGAIQSIFRANGYPPNYLHTVAACYIGKSHAKSKRLLVAAGMDLVE
jgi:hypothetical protein